MIEAGVPQEQWPASIFLELWEVCHVYWKGYQLLEHGRRYVSVGMAGAVPLGFSYLEIRAVAHDFGFYDLEREEFVDLIQMLDSIYLHHHAAKAKSKK